MNEQDDRMLGYAGMIAAGMTPVEAWQEIRAAAMDPEVRPIFAEMERTEEGREALDCARAAWARKGLPAPFDDLP